MGRSSKEDCEAYAVLLVLALNDLTTNGGKMSVKQLEETIKIRAADFIPLLKTHYSHIAITPAGYNSLASQVENDKGSSMIRKAKEYVCFVVNHLNPYWADPSSGGQFLDAMRTTLMGAWNRIEEGKKVKDNSYVLQPFDENFSPKEYLLFKHCGLAAGRSPFLSSSALR
jgi:hypothetical protein